MSTSHVHSLVITPPRKARMTAFVDVQTPIHRLSAGQVAVVVPVRA
ncbi:hypothetical protein [Modestobacter marinus]|uniref:Uncharacterized protein n=1 Tax=Modestobacter marinus TaxID=477641 RepID=A0A846LRG7_9ACTN|nr:hypothetical protein [Modestobacter marinus]NIH70126.1 hypothetical protein [Modestobacter marinus]